MFTLKPLSKDAIPAALEKAMRYRLLNEPGEAESVCHDILRTDPENHEALVTLLLALTDRLGKSYGVGVMQAREVLARLDDPYERAYYAGILCERRAKAQLHQGGPGPVSPLTNSFARRWLTMRKPRRSARPATTMRSCAGTPAPASSCRTASNRAPRRPCRCSRSNACP